MSDELRALGNRVVGRWRTESTHPALPGQTVVGASEIEWLDGEQFLILRSENDHPEIPNAISVIGDTGGLSLHYFDSRGVHRVYGITLSLNGWEVLMDRRAPNESFAPEHAPFSQRLTVTLDDGDATMTGRSQLSHDDVTWIDDLAVKYWRLP